MKLEITDSLAIDESELEEQFVTSPGPGGQNVNKVATAVQLRFDLAGSPSLPEGVRERARRLAGPRRLTKEGWLVIEARRFRTRERNREDARDRLLDLLRRAAVPPKKRRPTRPSRRAKQRRLQEKKERSERKRLRGPVKREE